jgi:signal peptide peptidase SppA
MSTGHWNRLLTMDRLRGIPVVAVVRLSGVITPLGTLRGGLSLTGLAPLLDRAFSLGGLKAVALAINSPGGSAAQSSLIARRIRDLAAEKKVPVFAFAEDVAASGGYWLATAADEIYADEASIIGSIGVISAGFGFQDLLQRVGIERRVHTAGPRKSMLDPFRAEDAADVARLEALQRDIHEMFKAQVRQRRGGRLKAEDDVLFSGEFWTGRRALELGLLDGVGDMRTVLRSRFGDKVKLQVVGARRGWLSRRMGLGSWAEQWAADLVAAVDERAHWSRFGL